MQRHQIPKRRPKVWSPAWTSKLLALTLGTGLALCGLELALQLHPPLQSTVRAGEIRLPVYHRLRWTRDFESSKLDTRIVTDFNELGFRGPSVPPDFASRLTFVTVGGSTTACALLTDGKTWPDRLAIELAREFPDAWLNNAGFSGHTTFAHAQLLDKVLAGLRPDYVLYLVGINDVARESPSEDDASIFAIPETSDAWTRTLARSELWFAFETLYRLYRARTRGLREEWELHYHEIATVSMSEGDRHALRTQHERVHLPAYERRLTDLVRATREADIEPILITQTLLAGDFVDPSSKVAFGALEITSGMDSRAGSELMELYNDVTRQVGARERIFVIDLASAFPKDSKYYYDFMHYSNEGAALVSEHVAAALVPFLKRRHP